MATFSSVTQQHVLQAIAEHDAKGAEHFLAAYGFTPSPATTLLHEGRRYDAGAVVGVAHRFATGRLATADEVANGLDAALAILRKRGFEVTEPPTAHRVAPSPTRTQRAATPRAATPRVAARTPAARAAAARDAPARLCPTCSMTLPATGVCDYCA